MNQFHYCNKTEILFGKGSVKNLNKKVQPYHNILIVYGSGSIKKNGLYDEIIQELKEKVYFELKDVMPNPRTEKVYEGIAMCKEHQIDFILAIGGGSVIDCAKFIAAGAKLKDDEDFWQKFFIDQYWIKEEDALSLGVISTMAATGSEMDEGGVITNWKEKLKLSGNGDGCYPKFSILDPTYTYTMPINQMVYGCIDIFSHIFEIYFSAPDTSNVSDYLAEGLMKCLIENIEVAIVNPNDYTVRANIMWCSTMALNGIIKCSKTQDWMSHTIEHALSALYDIPHGAGLSIVHPTYMKYIYKNAPEKFARFASNVWGVNQENQTIEELALQGIECTRNYFTKLGAPSTLAEVGIPALAIPEIVDHIIAFPTSYSSLDKADLIKILEMCAEK